jgi:predicted transcriptional regulator
MAREDISDEVKRFILKSVISVPYLEALLLLRDNPGRVWDVEHVARRLYINHSTTSVLLTNLHESGFIEKSDGEPPVQYYYQPATEDQRNIVDQVARAYATNLIGVTNLIHSKSGAKAQQFADAFILRKDL